MRQIGFTIIITVLLVLVGCDRKPEMEQPSSEKQSAADPVLAKVGSSTVRQSQFDVMMDRLTPEARKRESAKLHDTILQGLGKHPVTLVQPSPQAVSQSRGARIIC